MSEILKYAFEGFWNFIGILLIVSMILNFTYRIFNRILRFFTIKKHGYPPFHCDADGEFPTAYTKKDT